MQDEYKPIFSPRVRQTIYIIVTMGTAVVVPLWVAGILNDVVMAVWSSVSGAASLLAGFNVTQSLRNK